MKQNTKAQSVEKKPQCDTKKTVIRIIMLIVAVIMFVGVVGQCIMMAVYGEELTSVVIEEFDTGDLQSAFDEARGSLDPNNVTELVIKSGTLSAADYGVFSMLSGVKTVDLSAVDTEGGAFPEGLFGGRGRLESISLPKNTTTIGDGAFQQCNNLTEIVFPSTVKVIGARVFENCLSLSSISLPAGLESFGESCFAGCFELKSIDIPAGVTEIPAYAFSRCSGLTEVTIGGNISYIGDTAFGDCSGLKKVTFLGDAPETGNSILMNVKPEISVGEGAEGFDSGEWENMNINEVALPEATTTASTEATEPAEESTAADSESTEAATSVEAEDNATSEETSTAEPVSGEADNGGSSPAIIATVAVCSAIGAIIIYQLIITAIKRMDKKDK